MARNWCRPLRVSDFKKKPRRTTEAAFEALFAETLNDAKLYHRHMSDRFSGVPDQYIQRGWWVELKSLEYANGSVPYAAGMSIEQRVVCQGMCEADEKVMYLALVTTNEGQFVIYMPMWVALGEPGNRINVHDTACCPFHQPYEGKETLRHVVKHIAKATSL